MRHQKILILIILFIFSICNIANAAPETDAKVTGYFRLGKSKRIENVNRDELEVQARALTANNVQFDDTSAEITHPYWTMAVGDSWSFSGYGYISGNRMVIEGVAIETIYGVKCLKIKQTISGLDSVYEWWAQDVNGNIHTLGCSNQVYTYQANSNDDFPNLKLPASLQINDNWMYYFDDRIPDGTKKVVSTNAQISGYKSLLKLHWVDGDGSDLTWSADEYYMSEYGLIQVASPDGGWLRSDLGTIALTKSYLPYLIHTGSAGWQSFVSIINTNGESARIVLTARDTNGRSIGQREEEVGAGQRKVVNINPTTMGGDFPSDGIISLTITSSLTNVKTVGGFYSQSRTNTNDLITYPAIFPTDTTLAVPNIVMSENYETILALRNASLAAGKITLNLLGDTGEVIASNDVPITAGGTVIGRVDRLLPGFTGFGWLEIRSDVGVIAGTSFYNNKLPSRNTKGVSNLRGGSPRNAIIPVVQSDGENVQGYLVVANNSFARTNITLKFKNSSGTTFHSESVDIDSKSKIIFPYGPNEMTSWPGSGHASIEISSASTQVVYQSFEMMQSSSSSNGDIIVSNGQPANSERLIAPNARIDSVYRSFINLHNLGPSSVSPKFIMRNDAGEVIGEGFGDTLPYGGSQIYNLGQILGDNIGRGWLEVASGGPWLVGEIRIENIERNVFANSILFASSINFEPIIDPIPEQRLMAGEVFEYQLRVHDPEDDPISYGLTTNPDQMQISPDGIIRWYPDLGDVGSNNVTAYAEDSHGNRTEISFVIIVGTPGNNPPVVTQPEDVFINVNETFTYLIQATDPDGDSLTYTLGLNPSGMLLSIAGEIIWTPNVFQMGVFEVAVVVSDGNGNDELVSFNITVDRPNTAPQLPFDGRLRIPPHQELIIQVEGYDAEGDEIITTLVSGPTGLELGADGSLYWLPTFEDIGEHLVTIRLTDILGAFSETTFIIEVTASNRPPELGNIVDTLTAKVGEPFQYQLPVTDPDGEALYYELIDAPPTMTVDGLGLIEWIPAATDEGFVSFTVTIFDGFGESVTGTVLIVVLPPNMPPIIQPIDPKRISAGHLHELVVFGGDPDGDPISWSLINAPEGMTISSTGAVRATASVFTADQIQSALISWTPRLDQVGFYQIGLVATDTAGNSTEEYVRVEVYEAPNSAPFILPIPEQLLPPDVPFQFWVMAEDPDNDPLVFELIQSPTGMTIDPTTGEIFWQTPIVAANMQFPVTVRATDINNAFGEISFVIVVSDQAPTPTETPIDGSPTPPGGTVPPPTGGGGAPPPPPPTNTAPYFEFLPPTDIDFQYDMNNNKQFILGVTALDAEDSGNLFFAIENAPDGMFITNFGHDMAVLYWEPKRVQAGVYSVNIRVYDPFGNSTNANVSITATQNNLWEIYTPVSEGSDTIFSSYGRSMYLDSTNNKLYVLSGDGETGFGVDCLNIGSNTWTNIFSVYDWFGGDDKVSLPNMITMDSGGTLWFTNGLTIFKYNLNSNLFETYDCSNTPLKPDTMIRSIAAKGDHVWFGTCDGLLGYQISTDTFATFTNMPVKDIWNVVVAPNNDVWLGTGYGIAHLNPIGTYIEHFYNVNGIVYSIVFENTSSNAWALTENQGLFRYAGGAWAKAPGGGAWGLSYPEEISSITFNGSKLWVDTQDDPINKLKWTNAGSASFSTDPYNPTESKKNAVSYCMVSNNSYMFACFNNRIGKYDYASNWTYYGPLEDNGISDAGITDVISYNASQMYFTTRSGYTVLDSGTFTSHDIFYESNIESSHNRPYPLRDIKIIDDGSNDIVLFAHLQGFSSIQLTSGPIYKTLYDLSKDLDFDYDAGAIDYDGVESCVYGGLSEIREYPNSQAIGTPSNELYVESGPNVSRIENIYTGSSNIFASGGNKYCSFNNTFTFTNFGFADQYMPRHHKFGPAYQWFATFDGYQDKLIGCTISSPTPTVQIIPTPTPPGGLEIRDIDVDTVNLDRALICTNNGAYIDPTGAAPIFKDFTTVLSKNTLTGIFVSDYDYSVATDEETFIVGTDDGVALIGAGTGTVHEKHNDLGFGPKSASVLDIAYTGVAFNKLWVATNVGVARYDSLSWTHWTISDIGIPGPFIQIVLDPINTAVWVCNKSGQIAVFTAGSWNSVNLSNQLGFPFVHEIREMMLGNDALWIATTHGLVEIDLVGATRQLHFENRFIQDIEYSSAAGIEGVYVAVDDVLAWRDNVGMWTLFSTVNFNNSILVPPATIWFTTKEHSFVEEMPDMTFYKNGGIYVYNPAVNSYMRLDDTDLVGIDSLRIRNIHYYGPRDSVFILTDLGLNEFDANSLTLQDYVDGLSIGEFDFKELLSIDIYNISGEDYLFIGTNEGGLWIFNADDLTLYTHVSSTNSPLQQGEISGVGFDLTHYYICTEYGIVKVPVGEIVLPSLNP